jgi:hypothetical protein
MLLSVDAPIALKVKVSFLTRVLRHIQLGFSGRSHIINVVRPKVIVKAALIRVPVIIRPCGALGVDVAHMIRTNFEHNLPNLTAVNLIRRASMGTSLQFHTL